MKRALIILLAMACIMASFVGCGQADNPAASSPTASAQADNSGAQTGKSIEEQLLEPYSEPVTIKLALGYRESENPDTPKDLTPENATFIKDAKAKLNINIEYSWIVNADQYNEKFGAEMAAGNVPDIFAVTPIEFGDFQSQGVFADLTGAYEKYASPLVNELFNYDGKVLDSGKVDGKLYGLPYSLEPAQLTSQMYYDMNKLSKVGIESEDQLPKTIAEFEALLEKLAAADLDGNGKTGDFILPGCKQYYDAQLGDFGPFLEAYSSWPKGWVDNGSGTLEYMGTQPSVKDALSKLNEWYMKGYFPKDFAAQDIWSSEGVQADIVAGKYSILQGSWWIPAWPLNMNMAAVPDSKWVIGPTLSATGESPAILIDRYPVNKFYVVGRDCKNPEALLKLIYFNIAGHPEKNTADYIKNRTPEQKLEDDSAVYSWLPFQTWFPMNLRDNIRIISELDQKGVTELQPDFQIPNNGSFLSQWNTYQMYKAGNKSNATEWGNVWGNYFSRLDPKGGVAKMIELHTNGRMIYNEFLGTTPAMTKKQGELDKYRDNTFLSMIMGEIPVSDFEKYVESYNAQGGSEIAKEVNDWYSSRK